jgi:hypothetical protein
MDWSPDSHAVAYTDSHGAMSITIVDVDTRETTLTTPACGGLPTGPPTGLGSPASHRRTLKSVSVERSLFSTQTAVASGR